MNMSAWTVLIYALLILVGGMIGYNQAHSLPSLIAGVTFSLLLFACAIGMFKRSILAYTLSMVFILLLTFFFTYRYVLTAKFMPSGMMAIISAICFLFILTRARKKTKLI